MNNHNFAENVIPLKKQEDQFIRLSFNRAGTFGSCIKYWNMTLYEWKIHNQYIYNWSDLSYIIIMTYIALKLAMSQSIKIKATLNKLQKKYALFLLILLYFWTLIIYFQFYLYFTHDWLPSQSAFGNAFADLNSLPPERGWEYRLPVHIPLEWQWERQFKT